MKLYMTGVSAAAIAVAMAGAAAAQQDEGADQPPGGERGAAEFTCEDLSMMDTARLPGALYFIAGHRAGTGEGGDQQPAADGTAGEEAGAAAVQLRGFSEIPIEETIIACAETPDALVADVIAEQSAGGSPEAGDPGTDDAAATDDATATGAEAPAEEEPANGADTGNGDPVDADIEAGGPEGVEATSEPGGVRGGEIVSPEEAAGDDADATGSAGGANN